MDGAFGPAFFFFGASVEEDLAAVLFLKPSRSGFHSSASDEVQLVLGLGLGLDIEARARAGHRG